MKISELRKMIVETLLNGDNSLVIEKPKAGYWQKMKKWLDELQGKKILKYMELTLGDKRVISIDVLEGGYFEEYAKVSVLAREKIAREYGKVIRESYLAIKEILDDLRKLREEYRKEIAMLKAFNRQLQHKLGLKEVEIYVERGNID